jgi:hypothetical protein
MNPVKRHDKEERQMLHGQEEYRLYSFIFIEAITGPLNSNTDAGDRVVEVYGNRGQQSGAEGCDQNCNGSAKIRFCLDLKVEFHRCLLKRNRNDKEDDCDK